MGGGAHIFIFLVGEDVNANHVNLSMSVLASLGGGHFHNFAGTSLQHHVAVLAQGGALHGEGGGGAGLAGLEVEVGICHGAMGLGRCGERRISLQSKLLDGASTHRNNMIQHFLGC